MLLPAPGSLNHSSVHGWEQSFLLGGRRAAFIRPPLAETVVCKLCGKAASGRTLRSGQPGRGAGHRSPGLT